MTNVSRPNRDLTLLDPAFRRKVDAFLIQAQQQGHRIMVFEGWRSPERQRRLYAQGRTRPGPIVTWTLNSKHLTGQAVDIVFVINGQPRRQGNYDALITIGNKLGMRNLKPRETCHFEDNGTPLILGSTDTANQPLTVSQPNTTTILNNTLSSVINQPSTPAIVPISPVFNRRVFVSLPTPLSTTPLVLSPDRARIMFRQLFAQENPQGSSIFSNPDAAFQQCLDSKGNLKADEFYRLMMVSVERMKKVLQTDDAKLAEAVNLLGSR